MKKLTLILFFLLILLFSERAIFTTFKLRTDLDPPVLRARSSSSLNLSVYPVNAFGFKTPFKNYEVRFEVEEGTNLIEIIPTEANSKVIIKSKGIEGEALVGIYSLNTGLQIRTVLIKILPVGVT